MHIWILIVIMLAGLSCGAILGATLGLPKDCITDHPATMVLICGIVGAFLSIPIGILVMMLI